MKFILDDLEQPKAERIFVDRVEPRQAFWDAFSNVRKGREEPLVLHYYGVGGMGKTSLQTQLEKELQERCPSAKYVELDFDFIERREPYRLMGLLKKKLTRSFNFQFPLFDVACYTFLCRIGEDGDQKEIESFVGSSQVLNFLCDAASIIPGTSMIGDLLKLVDEGVAMIRNAFSNKKHLLRSFESMDIRQLREQLPIYFASDLRNNLKKEEQPFVIFLDTYEKLVNEFAVVGNPLQSDLWLRGPQGLIPRLPNTLWVLGGREQLKWPQLDGIGTWENVLHQYLLGALADSDAQEFLCFAGVKDLAVRRRICMLSDGLPASLDLYLEQYLREGDVSDTVAPATFHERVVRYMSEEEKTACYLLAAMDEWTQEEALEFAKRAGVPLSPALLERLCGFSFILTQDGISFHLMRNVGEVLRQHCPVSLSRMLAKRKLDNSGGSSTSVISFDSAPEKYVSLMLRTFQDEEACVEWVLDELDGPLISLRKSLNLDTYFAIVGLLKQRASQNWPEGTLEALADGYNGIGLYYAAQPEQSQDMLEKILEQVKSSGSFSVLYTVLEQYQHVAFCRKNLLSFVTHTEPLWSLFQQGQKTSYAERTAQLLGEAYEEMGRFQEAQMWMQRAPMEKTSTSQETERSKEEDTRLTQIQKELNECIQAKDFTQEEKAVIHVLMEEGRQTVDRLYGFDSREMFEWFFLEAQVYSKIEDYEMAQEIMEKILETSRTYFGETSGVYASVEFLRGMVGCLECLAKGDISGWPDYSARLAETLPVLKTTLGSENEMTWQTYILFKMTDMENRSLKEYREQLRKLREMIKHQNGIVELFQVWLNDLEDFPEEAGDIPAIEAVTSFYFGDGLEFDEEQPQYTMEQVVQQLMEAYQPEDIYTVYTGIPEKKLRNALESYGDDPEGKLAPYVLVLQDATVTETGKKGFLLFASGILYRESTSKQGVVELKDLESFTAKGRSVLAVNAKGDREVASFVCLKAKKAAQVLNGILELLKDER